MKSLASLLLAALLAAPVAVFAQAAPAAPAASAAPAAPAVPAAPVSAKPDLNAGSAKYAAVCASCHGADGNSGIPVNPKLAQQHPEYLLKQLQEFKAGKRPNAIMQPMASQLTDADMKNIAYWAGSQKGKAGFAKDKELVTLGERIYRGGIPDRQVAACAGCHSPNGAGIPAQFPRLSGQHADYTDAQLKGFRDGQRPNSVQMKLIAARMNDREIRAVSDYIAGLR
ncbi:cytochrome c [Caenimonas sp. SL110]|uniref:c-type cytochrome n=1 Tax=Caenimonas sp. SL110 TaxID=1450524 RepID=UPI000652FB76|nr:c-type cytochrome [Caenimonas sp. SL110]